MDLVFHASVKLSIVGVYVSVLCELGFITGFLSFRKPISSLRVFGFGQFQECVYIVVSINIVCVSKMT